MSGRPAVNERIAQRRAAVRSDRRRRRLRRTVLVLLTAATVAAGVAVERSSLVALDTVRVEGVERLTVGEVLVASGLEVGTSVLRVDLDGAQEQVEALPLVASATVARDGALGVVVTVEEVAPALTAVFPRGSVLVSAAGLVLGPGDAPGTPRVTVRGAVPAAGRTAASVPALGTAHAVALGMPGPIATLVDEYVAVSDDAVELVLEGGTVVRWGDHTRGDEKVRALGVVLEDLEGRSVAVIDVRAPSAPTVTP